jgi:hypothetical protein
MFHSKPSAAALLAALLTMLIVAACSSAPERPILDQFFTASRVRDNTSLQNVATVSFDPLTAGTVINFEIASIGPERPTPVSLKTLGTALADVKAEDDAFTKRKVDYQSDNLEAIRRVLEAEREKTTLKGKDAEVQAAWTKFREDGTQLQKKVADARKKLAAENALIELSVYDPRHPVDLKKYDGDLVTKDVTVSASVKLPSGQTAQKTLVVTMQRAILKGDREITGRWIVTDVKETAAPAGTKTS